MGPGVTRIAAVHLWALPLECAYPTIESSAGADPRGSSERHVLRAVRIDVRGRAVLIDVSADARRAGIRAGMTVTEARARLPELEVRERAVDTEVQRLEIAAEHLLAFGALVEVAPPAFLFVEIGRSSPALRKMLGEEPTERRVASELVRVMRDAGHEASVAIARDPDTARTLAAHLSRLRIAQFQPPPVEPRHAVRVHRRAPAARTARAPKSADAGRREGREGREARHEETRREGARRPELPSTVVVPPEREIGALAKLPLEALLWSDAIDDPEGKQREALYAVQSALRVLGVHDIAALRALPSAQVASRFGEAGALLVARANAKGSRPLRAFSPPERIVEEHELDAPIEDLEPILFVLRRIFARLEARLEARGLSAGSINLAFSVEPHLETAVEADAARAASSRKVVEVALRLARPSRRSSTFLSIAKEKLGGALPGAVLAVVAEVKLPSADRGAQLDLFSAYPRKVEEVSELVGRLRAALGDDAVFSPVVCDTHRPEAAWERRPFEVERALAERVERPPRVVKAELAPTKSVLEGASPRASYMLPEVTSELTVAEMPRLDRAKTGSVESVLAELTEKKRTWPKAIQRKVEDEPLPPLPPRPLELFEVPERATLLANNPGGVKAPRPAESAILVWRGERIRLQSLSGCERLEAEWWTPSPLAREYVVAEAEDGRKLWVFFEPSGEVFVHGVFD